MNERLHQRKIRIMGRMVYYSMFKTKDACKHRNTTIFSGNVSLLDQDGEKWGIVCDEYGKCNNCGKIVFIG